MNAILTLASNSPRRRELLSFGGWSFRVMPVHIDETPLDGEEALEYVRRMAGTKALAAAAVLEPDGIAITADTTVVHAGDILGKPANRAEAFDMLRRLRGLSHQVFTAIGVVRAGQVEPFVDVCVTNVPMRVYTDAEVAAYIDSGDPFDKAGGYAIQHNGFRPVEQLSGCYANVVGLPVCHLARALQRFDIPLQAEPLFHCRTTLGYTCQISAQILSGQEA